MQAPIVLLAASAVGSLISARGQKEQAEAQARALEYNAAVEEANAKAKAERAAYEEEIARKKSAKLLASQRQLYARAGVDPTRGTPLIVAMETAEEAEKEALAIRRQGEVDVAQSMNQARLNRYYAENTRRAGSTQAMSTILTGLGNIGGAYLRGQESLGYSSKYYTKSPITGGLR